MIDTFLSNIFSDDDFGALQCIFRLFKLLLQYHEPEVDMLWFSSLFQKSLFKLQVFLQERHMTPEVTYFSRFQSIDKRVFSCEIVFFKLFASSWFMTLHTQKSDFDTLIYLWDEFLLELDSRFHYFVASELLCNFKSEIMSTNTEEIPEYLSNIKIHNVEHARKLVKEVTYCTLEMWCKGMMSGSRSAEFK